MCIINEDVVGVVLRGTDVSAVEAALALVLPESTLGRGSIVAIPKQDVAEITRISCLLSAKVIEFKKK